MLNSFLHIKRTLTYLGLICFLELIGSCGPSGHAVVGESVEYRIKVWKFQNNKDSPYLCMPSKSWFQDSVGITELSGVSNVETDSSNVTTIETLGYRLVDLRKKWVYEYASFSDTAAITRKFRYTDTTGLPGGWKFDYRSDLAPQNIYLLPDTVINSISYKRGKINFEFNKVAYEGVGLFRCDKKNTTFDMDKSTSKKVGCPLVSFMSYPIINPHAILSQEVEFMPNNFHDSVVKVFKAWKKNESMFPVQ